MSHAVTARVAKMKSLKILGKALRKMGVTSFLQDRDITFFGKKHHIDLGVDVPSSLGNRYPFGYRQLPDGQLELVRESMENRGTINRIEQDVLQNYISCEVDETLQSLGFDLENAQAQGQKLKLTFSRWR